MFGMLENVIRRRFAAAFELKLYVVLEDWPAGDHQLQQSSLAGACPMMVYLLHLFLFLPYLQVQDLEAKNQQLESTALMLTAHRSYILAIMDT